MRKMFIVDAFTQKPYTGSPAGVMIVDEFSNDLQKIAGELNFATTAFIKILGNNYFNVRWFSPITELKFCGHALLAAAHIVYQNNIATSNDILVESLSGQFKVLKEADKIVLDLPLEPVFKNADTSIFQKLFAIQNIKEAFYVDNDILVIFDDENDVKKLLPNFSAIRKIEAEAIIISASSHDPTYDFISRVFAPRVGINEDPVTGSSHCKLASYWSNLLGKKSLKAYQASSRGGEIDIQIKDARVLLKGKALTIMSGQWEI